MQEELYRTAGSNDPCRYKAKAAKRLEVVKPLEVVSKADCRPRRPALSRNIFTSSAVSITFSVRPRDGKTPLISARSSCFEFRQNDVFHNCYSVRKGNLSAANALISDIPFIRLLFSLFLEISL